MSRNSQALTAAQQAVVAAQVAAAEDAATAAAIPLPLTHAALVASGANVTAGTTPGTFAAGDDARITGALSATTASATYAPVVEAVNTVATGGAAQTIPAPATYSVSRITLTETCTLTFPTAAAGKSFTLVLVQDGTGSRTVVWPGTVKWAGAAAPTLSTGINKIDYLSFVCTDGTNWAGFVSGLDMR